MNEPLILLGGTLCDSALWRPLRQRLAEPCRTLPLRGEQSAQAMAEKLLAKLPPRFALCGFSLGAIVALHMQALAPQRICGLALISANPFADAAENADARRAAVAEAAQYGLSRFITRRLWTRYVARQRWYSRRLHRQITGMAERCGLTVFRDQTEIAIHRADQRQALARLQVPVLILNGNEDPICTPAHHAALSEAAPQARWLTFAGCGHFVPLEAVEQTADALNHWLTEIRLCATTH